MSERTEQEIRASIVAEADTWLRTPWRHMGDIKGVGVDCAMILVRVFQAPRVGLVDPSYDPRPYTAEWFLHQDEERYLNVVRQFAREIPKGTGLPGDIDVYNFGRHAAHGGIIVSESLLIHAYRPHRMVELHERRALEHRLHSTYRVIP